LNNRERETEHDVANAGRREPWAYICLSGQYADYALCLPVN